MKILHLENRGSVSVPMADYFADTEHTYLSAYNVCQANTLFRENKIDCLIIDLNLGTDCLTEEEAEKTKNGLLTGWIWLTNYIFKEHSELRGRTIIYSEYLDALRHETNADDLEDLILISKNESTSSAEHVLKAINKIKKNLASGRSNEISSEKTDIQ